MIHKDIKCAKRVRDINPSSIKVGALKNVNNGSKIDWNTLKKMAKAERPGIEFRIISIEPPNVDAVWFISLYKSVASLWNTPRLNIKG